MEIDLQSTQPATIHVGATQLQPLATSSNNILSVLEACVEKYRLILKPATSSLRALVQTLDPSTTTHVEVGRIGYLGNRGLIALTEVIRVSLPLVTVIEMSHARLYASDDKPGSVSGNTTIRAMCANLAGHPSLQRWDLSGNDIGVAALRDIVQLAKHTPTLTEVILTGTQVTKEDTWQLDAVLALNVKRTESLMKRSTKRGAAATPTTTTTSTGPLAASRGINYQRSKKNPHWLNEETMMAVRAKSAQSVLNGSHAELPWPLVLSNIEQCAATDGKARPGDISTLLLPAWAKHHPKPKELTYRIMDVYRHTSVWESFVRMVFPAPPPPPSDSASSSLPNIAIGYPLLAESDYEDIVLKQKEQQNCILEALTACSSHISVRILDSLWEFGDHARYVYLIDPTLRSSQHAQAVICKEGKVDNVSMGTTAAGEGSGTNLMQTLMTVSTSMGSKTFSMPAGQFIGYEDSMPSAGDGAPPSGNRRTHCYLVSTSEDEDGGAPGDDAASDDRLISVFCLPKEMFELYLAEPLYAQRISWRRLIDAMPCLLGFDPSLRWILADHLSSTTIVEKDLAGGVATLDSIAFPTELLRTHVVIVEEGHLLVRRKYVEMCVYGRGDVISLSPDAPEVESVFVALMSGNMPAWKFCAVPIDKIKRSVPLEVFQAVVSKNAKPFTHPETKNDGNSSGWKRRV